MDIKMPQDKPEAYMGNFSLVPGFELEDYKAVLARLKNRKVHIFVYWKQMPGFGEDSGTLSEKDGNLCLVTNLPDIDYYSCREGIDSKIYKDICEGSVVEVRLLS